MNKVIARFGLDGWCSSVLLGLLFFAAGCASAPKQNTNAIFFPPAPDEPRLQYLTGFGGESDLREKGGFTEFVFGQERVIRPIWKPYGVTARPGMLYVADTQAANVAFVDLKEKRLRYLKPAGRGAFKLPICAVVDDKGNCFVSDSSLGQVVVFDKDNVFRGEIGKPGEMKPAGLQIVGNKLYVCDVKNHRVSVFNTETFEPGPVYPRDPNDEKSKLYGPTNVAVDKNGRVIVSDTGGFAVQVYAADGAHLQTIGEQGLTPGRFAMPKGIGVDREGRIYVADSSTALVQMFDADGKLLMYFGEPTTSGPAGLGGLHLPAGLCIDYDNVDLYQKFVAPGYAIEFLVHVVSQAGTIKVGTYGFLKKAS